jgi:hypothetical protein
MSHGRSVDRQGPTTRAREYSTGEHLDLADDEDWIAVLEF